MKDALDLHLESRKYCIKCGRKLPTSQLIGTHAWAYSCQNWDACYKRVAANESKAMEQAGRTARAAVELNDLPQRKEGSIDED